MNDSISETICDLCGSKQYSCIYNMDDAEIVKCDSCGLVFVNPIPDEKQLVENVYNEGYFNAEKGYGIDDLTGASKKNSIKKAKELFNEIEKHTKPGKVLDIGCSAGFYLDVARKRGWQAEGIDIGDYACRFARENLGLNVRTGNFINSDFKKNDFDVVLLLDVIEHLTSPRQGLMKIRSILSNGGKLIIETPNFDSAPSKILGKEWGLIEPAHHLFYFTPQTITRLLAETGFEVESVTFPKWGLTDLFLSAGSFKKAGLKIGLKEKNFVKRYLKMPRYMARTAVDIADRAVFTPLNKNRNGIIIKIVAEKTDREI